MVSVFTVYGSSVCFVINHEELWRPSDTTLIGIERGWLKNSSCVCCTQIQHWLTLVAYDYPDLKEIIDESLRP